MTIRQAPDTPTPVPESVSIALARLIGAAIDRNGGWLPFDRFMALALYAPGLGYYANASRKFGLMPGSGSDFVTAPELSPLFGRALARQVAQALEGSGTRRVWEFGAGSGALAAQLLEALPGRIDRYTIVDLSATLRARQRERLAGFGDTVQWIDTLPEAIDGVVVGNEVLDAMPVQLLHFDGTQWFERGVAARGDGGNGGNGGNRGNGVDEVDEVDGVGGLAGFAWQDRPTTARPPVDGPFAAGTTVEVHPQAEAFITTVAERLTRGAAFFIDYGFPAREYYHPQRTGGTLMCHRAHLADDDPLVEVGAKDITAHVDFTGIALAAQAAGLDVLGYTTQAHFLINCGVLDLLQGADVPTIAHTQKLLTEHEMGELFKVIGFARQCDPAFNVAPLGFTNGDRTHTL